MTTYSEELELELLDACENKNITHCVPLMLDTWGTLKCAVDEIIRQRHMIKTLEDVAKFEDIALDYGRQDNDRLSASNAKLRELAIELWHNIQLMENWESRLEDSEILQDKMRELMAEGGAG